MHRWFPWRYLVTRMARSQGFIDPLTLYARLQQFAQPSEVAEPVELLRAGAVFHARGLINNRVIQHNLDWVWPYWVERQFDPSDVSFLPRAFSLTHVNLTNRNWTAVGLPGREALPIVDPRGLLTPFWDSWSIDVWCMDDNGEMLLPSRAIDAEQTMIMNESLSVRTVTKDEHHEIATEVALVGSDTGDVCRLSANVTSEIDGWLIFSLRPCNPEGVSFVDHVALNSDRCSWRVNDRDTIKFDQVVDAHHASQYHDADVFVHLKDRVETDASRCQVGLCTAAAMFRLKAHAGRLVHADIPVVPRAETLKKSYRSLLGKRSSLLKRASENPVPGELRSSWPDALHGSAKLQVPDVLHRRLYDSALRTLILCTPDNTYAGPYTYKRYWYRDAVFIGHGLLCAGLVSRASRLVEHFPERQSKAGYYHSQAGEWDANGEVLWLVDRLSRFSNEMPDERLWHSLQRGADWIESKRLPDYGGQAHEGLLPAGFSAEHLGPNDHYYWDNYWSWAGLDCAARMASSRGLSDLSLRYRESASQYHDAIERSLVRLNKHRDSAAIPAAPARRMDAGAIGSVAVSYPLQLCAPDDDRLVGTLDFLLEHCFHEHGFFQDMIHSGINAYLTLHVAQALMRKADPRYQELVRTVARLASPTGHWPEAIHPHTGGGCMGDGHHAWAAAEWVAMMRNAFMVEEGDTLVLGLGLLPEWLDACEPLTFGPAPSLFGTISVSVTPVMEMNPEARDVEQTDDSGEPADVAFHSTNGALDGSVKVAWQAHWHDEAPVLHIRIPGFTAVTLEAGSDCHEVIVSRCLS